MARFGRKIVKQSVREKRRSERKETSVSAIVETPASRQPATVTDISQEGARFEGSIPPLARRDVRVRLAGRTVFGSVAWRSEKAFGVRFEDPLTQDDKTAIDLAAQNEQAERCGLERDTSLQELANDFYVPSASANAEGDYK